MPLVTQAELARQLGIDHKQIQREIKANATFPLEWIEGERRFDVATVRQWRESNIKQRKTGDAARPAETRRPLLSNEDPMMKLLRSGKATPVEFSETTMQLSMLRLARAAEEGTLGANEIDGAKKSMQENRQTVSDWLDLQERIGRLIPVDALTEILGEFIAILERYESNMVNALPGEFQLWSTDKAFMALSQEEQGNRIRQWAQKHSRELRRAEAQASEKLSKREG